MTPLFFVADYIGIYPSRQKYGRLWNGPRSTIQTEGSGWNMPGAFGGGRSPGIDIVELG